MWRWTAAIAVLASLSAVKVAAAPVTLVNENFDSYSGAVSSFTSPAFNFPVADRLRVENGYASRGAATSLPGAVGMNGVQLVNWNSHSAPNSVLVRPGASFRCNVDPRTGTNYVWEFWMLSSKANDAAAGYRISLVNEGADINEQDFIIFRSGRQATTNNVTGAPNDNNSGIEGVDNIQEFAGINTVDGPAAAIANRWVTITNESTGIPAYVTNNTWNHYKIVADNPSRTFKYYVNDMVTPVNSLLYAARPQEMPITGIRFANDGNNTVSGNYYTLIDDVSLTVDGNLVDLATGVFTEGFEGYTASTSANTNAADNDPKGPWITCETAGNGNNAAFAPTKVQVVDSSVSAPHSGSKCLMVSQGQAGGATISWGQATNEDVKITWWAKVQVTPNDNAIFSVYLRVSLYAWENNFSSASDTILFGYGHRGALPNGGANSILTFSRWFNEWFNNGSWGDTLQSYTPDVWEEYQLTTNVKLNSYTLIKNPSSTPVVVVKDGQYIASWATVKKFHTVAFSTSNNSVAGANPPTFIDDITIEAYTNPEPVEPRPYSIAGTGPAARFTNYTVLNVPGRLIGGVTVDPTDNTSILFTIDEDSAGEIRRATKVASGNWVVDPTPILSGMYNPNACIVGTNGTLWWVVDNVRGSQASALRRLKAPWNLNTVEEVITDFGPGPIFKQDQTCDLAFYVIGGVTKLAVLDRGNDDNNNPNAIWVVDPETTTLNQTAYNTSLVAPDSLAFGAGLGGNANAIATLPHSGELVTIWEDTGLTAPLDDGVVMAWDTTTGAPRQLSTAGSGVNWGAGIAIDPTTDRIWFSDRVNTVFPQSAFATPRICSIDTNTVSAGSPNPSAITELTFPNIAPTADRGDRHVNFHEPGMAFSTNGSFLVVGDQALCSGGGRLLIFHSEPFVVAPISITSVTRSGGNASLAWTSGGAVNYVVQRSATVDGTYAAVSGILTGTSFTDASAPAGNAFYKIVAFPQN